jgi:DNA-binding CsgD family transcriptional regulator
MSFMAPARFHFVGREEEIALLESHSRGAVDSGWVDLVSGEPGIGKSALLAELEGRLAIDDISVHTGRCIEGIAPPYWPWIEITRSVASSVDMKAFASTARIRFESLEAFIPGLFPLPTREVVATPWHDELTQTDDFGRFSLFQAIYELMRFASKEAPVVLFIEDLHWADHGTCELLEFLAREVDRIGLEIICTYRHTDLDRKTPMARAVGKILSLPRSRLTRIGELSLENVKALLVDDRDEVGEEELNELATEIHRRTDGSALFVRALIDATHVPGIAVTERILPENVRHLVGLSLDRLTENQLEVIAHAAILGTEQPVSWLLRLIEPLSLEAATDALEAAGRHGLLYQVQTTGEQYRFRHEIIRETIAGELTLGRRVQIHARCAEVLEELRLEGHDVSSEALFYHFSQSETGAGGRKVGEWALASGRGALSAHDPESAIRFLEAGLRTIGPKQPVLAIALQATIAEVYADVRNFTENQKCTDRAFELALKIGKASATRELFASLTWPRFLSLHGCELATRALDLLEDESTSEILSTKEAVIASIYSSSYMHSGGADIETERLSADCARKAADRGDLDLAAGIAHFRSHGFNLAGKYDSQLAEIRWIRTLYKQTGDPVAKMSGLREELDALGRLNRHPEAVRLVSNIEELCKQYPFDVEARHALQMTCFLYLKEADWESFDRVAALNRSLRPSVDLQDLRWYEFYSLLERDRLDDAQALLQLKNSGFYDDVWRVNATPRFVLRSAARNAVHLLLYAVATVLPEHDSSRSRSMANACRALAAGLEGDIDTLREILPSIGTELLDGGWEIVGYLYELAGDERRAEELYQKGLDEERYHRPRIGWITFRLACLYAKCDRELGAEWMIKAKTHAGMYGLKLLERRVRENLEVDGFEDVSRETPDLDSVAPAGLTAREIEVLREVVAGKSDAEIGATLFISTKTASNHVGNILRKTGCGNRTEAARFAAEHGL